MFVTFLVSIYHSWIGPKASEESLCLVYLSFDCNYDALGRLFIHIFMQIFISFFDWQLKQQICYSFTLLISYGSIKMAFSI